MRNRDSKMAAIIVRHVRGYEPFCFEVFYPEASNLTGFLKCQSVNLAASGHCQIWPLDIVDIDYYLHGCEPTSQMNALMVANEIERRYGLEVRLLKSLP